MPSPGFATHTAYAERRDGTAEGNGAEGYLAPRQRLRPGAALAFEIELIEIAGSTLDEQPAAP